MPSKKFEWLERVKAVEREYVATRLALRRLSDIVHQDATALEGNLQVRDLQNACDRLEGTYLVRLFAEFETCLRTFWLTIKKSNPRTRDLLNSVTGKKNTRIPYDHIKHAHDVRKYRNNLVHEREK